MTVSFKYVAAIALSMLFSISACSQPQAPGNLLDKSAFDTEIDGKPVSLYTITNGRISAQVTNYAGYVVGIYVPDKDGNYANVVSHNDSIKMYTGPSRAPLGAALGRYANRIANGAFTLDGVEYSLTKNNGGHTLHGGTQGFDHTVWTVDKVTPKSVEMSCVLPDGTDGFPGTLKTVLTFAITDDDGLSISYQATTDKPTVCNLSHHVYFNLDGCPADSVTNHIVSINADTITEVDRALIPTGNILPVDGTAYDLRQPTRIGDRQFNAPMGRFVPGQPMQMPQVPEGMVRSYDQNFCLNHSAAGKLEAVATAYSPDSGRFMEVWNDQPGLQLYTGGRVAFAMESQLYPDSPNHPDFPSSVLRPGETYKHTVVYKFSTK